MRQSRGLLDIEPTLLALREILPSGCWILKNREKGRPSLRFCGKKDRVYRWAALIWLDFNVWNTAGWEILHKCDNEECWNPDHLFIGTQADNLEDMRTKGRFIHGSKPHGEDHYFSKLTDKDVRTIRKLRSRGMRRSIVATRFGVCEGTITKITKHRGWKHLAA